MTKRTDTTVTAAIKDGQFMGRTLLTRGQARDARLAGERVVQVFSAEYADATVIGSASAPAVVQDVRHRIAVQTGPEAASAIFGKGSYFLNPRGKKVRQPSPVEKAAHQAMRTGGVLIDTPLGSVRLDTHGWIVV